MRKLESLPGSFPCLITFILHKIYPSLLCVLNTFSVKYGYNQTYCLIGDKSEQGEQEDQIQLLTLLQMHQTFRRYTTHKIQMYLQSIQQYKKNEINLRS